MFTLAMFYLGLSADTTFTLTQQAIAPFLCGL